MESSTPYKGGEIDSRQAEAIDTLSVGPTNTNGPITHTKH